MNETAQERARRLFASVKEKQMWVDAVLGEGSGAVVRANYRAEEKEILDFMSREKGGAWDVDMDMHVGETFRWLVLKKG